MSSVPPSRLFRKAAMVLSEVAYGAARLAPLFSSPPAWRVLDVFVGCVM